MDSTIYIPIMIVLLTLLSLFFSLYALAIRGVSRVQIHETFKKAGKEQSLDDYLKIAEDISLTCGFFRLAANAGIVLALAHLLADRHYLVTLIVGVFIIESFALAIPHAWSKHAGDYILPRTLGLLKILRLILLPVLTLFALHDRLVRRLMGISARTQDEEQEVRQEQLISMVEQGQREGVVDEEELEMIENVLELDEMTAEQTMTPRTDLAAIAADSPLDKILALVAAVGHSRIPVYEGTVDNIIGILYAKDLLDLISTGADRFDLRKIIRKAYFVPETKPLRSLLHEFKKQKLHIAVVLDEYGGTAGIITIEDIFEQLVGDIADEYEKPEPESYKKINETTTDVDARMYIDDVNGHLEINLPDEEDYDTLGGFVFSHLGTIPKVGDSFEYQNLRLTITAAEARSVRRVKIEKLTATSDSD